MNRNDWILVQMCAVVAGTFLIAMAIHYADNQQAIKTFSSMFLGMGLYFYGLIRIIPKLDFERDVDKNTGDTLE